MGNKLVTPQPIKNPIARIFVLGSASGLGLGYAPFAPGTFGSLLGIPLGLFLVQYPTWLSLLICAVFLVIFVPVADRAGIHWGNRDSGRIVIDEVLGQSLALLGAKAFLVDGQIPLLYIAIAFLLFRLFDITKPAPARSFDEKPSGWGVMMDDVIAGLYAALVMHFLAKIVL